MVQKLSNDIGFTPTQKVEYELDALLAEAAIEIATKRHAGSIKAIYMPTGLIYVQYEKDLTEIKTLIGTGGVFTYNEKSRDILRKSLFDECEPSSLRPKNPNLFIDRDYMMSAMGLLAEVYPKTAFEILRNLLICYTNQS